MDRTINSIGLIVLSIALVVIAFLAMGRVDQWLRNTAIAECAALGTFSTVTQGTAGEDQSFTTTSTEPIRSIYKACIEDKGYETAIK